MKVICSVGKGELEHEECLQCALKGGNYCGFDYTHLRAMFDVQDRTDEIHATDLVSDCTRKVYLDKKNPSPEHVHMRLNLLLGISFHGLMEGDDEHIQTEIRVQHKGLIGTIDAYYPKTGVVVDHKTTKRIYVDRLPYGKHAQQLQIYNYLLTKNGLPVNQMYVNYIDKSGPSECSSCKRTVAPNEDGILTCPGCGKQNQRWHTGAVRFPIPPRPMKEIEPEIERRMGEIKSALSNGHIPEASTGWECKYCPHWRAGKCPEGAKEMGMIMEARNDENNR